MLYSRTHMPTVGVKGLKPLSFTLQYNTTQLTLLLACSIASVDTHFQRECLVHFSRKAWNGFHNQKLN